MPADWLMENCCRGFRMTLTLIVVVTTFITIVFYAYKPLRPLLKPLKLIQVFFDELARSTSSKLTCNVNTDEDDATVIHNKKNNNHKDNSDDNGSENCIENSNNDDDNDTIIINTNEKIKMKNNNEEQKIDIDNDNDNRTNIVNIVNSKNDKENNKKCKDKCINRCKCHFRCSKYSIFECLCAQCIIPVGYIGSSCLGTFFMVGAALNLTSGGITSRIAAALIILVTFYIAIFKSANWKIRLSLLLFITIFVSVWILDETWEAVNDELPVFLIFFGTSILVFIIIDIFDKLKENDDNDNDNNNSNNHNKNNSKNKPKITNIEKFDKKYKPRSKACGIIWLSFNIIWFLGVFYLCNCLASIEPPPPDPIIIQEGDP